MSAPADRFEMGRRDAEQMDAMDWPLALAYMVAFFGSIIAAHLWPLRWWQ